MYQTISEEMINMFATIVGFNNLIGEPINKYRLEYKDMANVFYLINYCLRVDVSAAKLFK